MKLAELKNKSILILGFGRDGEDTLDFLKNKFPGKKIGIADREQDEKYLEKLNDYEVIIKSPGIPFLPEIRKAKEEGKVITSSTAIFLQNCQGKIVGVTGTKGKSTTASLIYEVLKKGGMETYLIGNIGQPALNYLEKDNKKAIFVYELSSFQLSDLEVSPHIAVITNIYPEHLDYHNNFTFYVNAKKNIANFQTKKDYLIYNQDIPEVVMIAENCQGKKMPFSGKDTALVEQLIGKEAKPLLGEFNLLNIVPAILVGRLLKIPDPKIVEAILNFKPLPHRLEFVADKKGIRFYNDSLSTIPQATIAALAALGKRAETLIAGGFDRGIDYENLGEVLASSNVKNLILFPTTGEKIWKAVKHGVKQGLSIKKFDVTNMKEAVRLAYEHTDRRKICLLSPASSSFNLFKDYEDRGNQFKKWVVKLGEMRKLTS